MNNPLSYSRFDVSDQTFWRTTLGLTFFFNAAMLWWSVLRWIELKVILYRSIWGVALLLYLGILACCAWAFFAIKRGKFQPWQFVNRLENFPLWRALGAGIFVAVVTAIPYFKFTYRIGEVVKKSTQDPVLSMIIFYWLVWWLVLLAAGGLKISLRTTWAGGFAAALVLMGVVYEIFTRYHAITDYPFSLGWSESSRYYYASLVFSETIYGEQLPLSTLHPSRYILQSIPYIVPSLDLTAHRIWQFMLWIGLTGFTAWALAWRVFRPVEQIGDLSGQTKGLPYTLPSGTAWAFGGLTFLLLLRVGVYYHLLPMIFLPVLFVSARHPWRSLLAVIAASAWAGISRVNWFPVPAMLAIAIYLMEEPLNGKSIFKYLAQPAFWAITGLLTAFFSQLAYIPLSGNAENATAFTSSFTSDLLPYRLWPNDLYPLGIVPAILVVCGPALAILLLGMIRGNKLHPLRWVGLWAMLTTLFAGGLVVSVKIGGGGDLHNMDAFAALLFVVSGWFIGEKVKGESAASQPQSGNTPWLVSALALVIPVLFLIPALSPLQRWDKADNQHKLQELKALVEAAQGPVLFVNERHLVTFGQIRVPLVAEYENVSLMEMAMSNNSDVLGRFYADLANKRFALIVAGKQNLGIKTEGVFFEENNAWNSRISPYILCYYQPINLLETGETKLEIYAPRFGTKDCP